ncbi:MAG: RNA-directed DNA polymerase [Nostoc sp. DedQUE08]|uniref:RNA-directed DNA polymerase n=1 Tax=Nostoc sp. DedQUE08 TaxID=3075393 RepID=UPI002AD2C940|nr:RNA-directed DNA polymerase [Nostoc sp. DedQUE08]MDZ8066754.1 RNA-directed DNA polymerase [Nostoc sp. DedQUE08]
MKLEDTSLEWALKHLTRYYDSDFYPKSFEFEAIAYYWVQVKNYILNLELLDYTPRTPFASLAFKVNRTFRVVHQLDPVDALIFTALVYEITQIIEDYRIPVCDRIACSYRIKTDVNGSFFEKDDDGWTNYIEKSDELANSYPDGFVLLCDITDFYNQIYLHRIQNIVSEAGSSPYYEHATVLEKFLMGLNTNTSRGIPVGPMASMVLAEAIMGDIDKKIATFTRDFTRWVDDIRIFFSSKEQAQFLLHELTRYLYTSHRLVLSDHKTQIITVNEFRRKYHKSQEKIEKEAVLERFAGYLHEKRIKLSNPYPSILESNDKEAAINFEMLESDEKFKIITAAYEELFVKIIGAEYLDLGLTRYLLRQATSYRYRNLVPIVLDNFETLLPVIREVVIYLNRVLSERQVQNYKNKFEQILTQEYLALPYINIWVFNLFQNEHFNKIILSIDYGSIKRVREKALIAKRKRDTTWVKDHKDGLDVLGPWDKRAILYAATVLSPDEMTHWLNLASARGDILDKAIVAYLRSKNKP